MQAVILAAGAGKRLRPLTLDRSKAMAPICGRPMVEWIMAGLADAGVREFVVVVADPDDDVARFARGWGGAARVDLVVQPERRGMGHAVRCAAAAVRGRFLVSACDNILETDYLRALFAQHEATGANATLSLERVHTPEAIRKTAIVELDGSVIRSIVEKPEPEDAPTDISSMPCYLFEPRIVDYLDQIPLSPRGEYELQDAIRMLIERDGGVHGLLAERRWQVTNVDDLLAVNHEFLDRGHTRAPAGVDAHGPVHVAPGATVGEGAAVGPYTVLEAGCRVGVGAVVERSLVLADAVVPDGARVSGEVVVAE